MREPRRRADGVQRPAAPRLRRRGLSVLLWPPGHDLRVRLRVGRPTLFYSIERRRQFALSRAATLQAPPATAVRSSTAGTGSNSAANAKETSAAAFPFTLPIPSSALLPARAAQRPRSAANGTPLSRVPRGASLLMNTRSFDRVRSDRVATDRSGTSKDPRSSN